MALIYCEECGKNISDQSAACIHCGYPISKSMEDNVTESANVNNENDTMLDEYPKILMNLANVNVIYRSIVALLLVFVIIILVYAARYTGEYINMGNPNYYIRLHECSVKQINYN